MRHIYFILESVINLDRNFASIRRVKRERKRNSNNKAKVIFSSSLLFICSLLEIVWSYGAVCWKRKGRLSSSPSKGKNQIRARDSRAGD